MCRWLLFILLLPLVLGQTVPPEASDVPDLQKDPEAFQQYYETRTGNRVPSPCTGCSYDGGSGTLSVPEGSGLLVTDNKGNMMRAQPGSITCDSSGCNYEDATAKDGSVVTGKTSEGGGIDADTVRTPDGIIYNLGNVKTTDKSLTGDTSKDTLVERDDGSKTLPGEGRIYYDGNANYEYSLADGSKFSLVYPDGSQTHFTATGDSRATNHDGLTIDGEGSIMREHMQGILSGKYYQDQNLVTGDGYLVGLENPNLNFGTGRLTADWAAGFFHNVGEEISSYPPNQLSQEDLRNLIGSVAADILNRELQQRMEDFIKGKYPWEQMTASDKDYDMGISGGTSIPDKNHFAGIAFSPHLQLTGSGAAVGFTTHTGKNQLDVTAITDLEKTGLMSELSRGPLRIGAMVYSENEYSLSATVTENEKEGTLTISADPKGHSVNLGYTQDGLRAAVGGYLISDQPEEVWVGVSKDMGPLRIEAEGHKNFNYGDWDAWLRLTYNW